MKKRLSLVSCVLCLVLALSGCGGSPSSNDVSGDPGFSSAPAPIGYDSISVDGVDESPSLGWEKTMFETYFQDQYTDVKDAYIFGDLGFAVDFSDGSASYITISDNSACSCRGGLTVGSKAEDVITSWGTPSKESDTVLMYFIDSSGELCAYDDAEAGIMFSLEDGSVTQIVISNDL